MISGDSRTNLADGLIASDTSSDSSTMASGSSGQPQPYFSQPSSPSSSSGGQAARPPVNSMPVEYYTTSSVNAFNGDRARRASGTHPRSPSGTLPDSSAYPSPILLLHKPQFLRLRTSLRALAVLLSFSLLVFTVIDGIFLPRGSDWDLLWDILVSLADLREKFQGIDG
jgi:hypothetical protein